MVSRSATGTPPAAEYVRTDGTCIDPAASRNSVSTLNNVGRATGCT
jgi:hypothetical protein